MQQYPTLKIINNKYKLDKQSREHLKKLYETHTIKQLAEIYNVSTKTIHKLLKANNIPTRPRGRPPHKKLKPKQHNRKT